MALGWAAISISWDGPWIYCTVVLLANLAILQV
jgi:hypothetical protein